jgi:hypothetical protein
LLSLTLTGDGTLLLRSDPANPANAQVLLNGVVQGSAPWSTVGSVVIRTGNAPDTVNIENAVAPATVDVTLTTGNDQVFLSPTAHRMANIQSTLTLHGGPGLVNINDVADTGSHSVTLSTNSSGASLTGLTQGGINFGLNSLRGLTITGSSASANIWTFLDTPAAATGGSDPVVLNTGTVHDIVQVNGTEANAPLTVNTGNSINNDLVNIVGSGGVLSSVKRAVTLNNAHGTMTAAVTDFNDTAAHPNVMLTATSLTGLATGTFNFGPNSVTSLSIQGGAGNSTYTITGAPGTTANNLIVGTDLVNVLGTANPLTITTAFGSGIDTITLGDANNTLNGITAPVTVNAANTDTLTLQDQGTAAARSYTVTATTVSWTGGPTVSYTRLSALNLSGGGGADTFAVNSSSATAAPVIFGGAGNNTPVGSNGDNFWNVVGSNTGFIASSAYASVIAFANMANLTSGTGGDYYFFNDGASISGNLTGAGADTLDFSPYTTSVVVDLALTAPGTDTGVGGTVSGIASVAGGSGVPASAGVFNLLIGSGGDFLEGGTGRRNIVVAGGSPSTLVGGDGEDLLIGGSTLYDTQAGLANWQAIATYWAGTDPFATRVANVQSGTGVPV